MSRLIVFADVPLTGIYCCGSNGAVSSHINATTSAAAATFVTATARASVTAIMFFRSIDAGCVVFRSDIDVKDAAARAYRQRQVNAIATYGKYANKF